jgi:hypothetical protein
MASRSAFVLWALMSLGGFVGVARADIRLPAIVGDHMVLQRDLPLPIWGWADPGEEVTVTLGEAKARATADANGKWRVTLPAMKTDKALEMTVAGKNSIRLKFKHAGGGLVSRDGKPLSWFSIAAADKKFLPAEAVIDGEFVVVRSPSVTNPVAVRFGWHRLAEPNLANKAGLPASPFRTDAWSDATAAAPPGN